MYFTILYYMCFFVYYDLYYPVLCILLFYIMPYMCFFVFLLHYIKDNYIKLDGG